ncbi:hypothetical protein CERSUDRAFT_114865 [Gelatoporia subvermispora B]|uniref:Uncharacterized protein n=1 Tax=Ceriporiopsis subvermispora (strain B) TaxID=914234 RepID=M2QIW5_CERS8|nr:hypothetical protein CERSUDRAFT_114865 [Gelatoporia subvermispora B]
MSTRAPPVRVSDGPPAYTMVSRVYRSSLRPVVAVMGIISAVWLLLWYINAFRVLNYDKEHGEPKLVPFAIVLGVIYTFGCAVEVGGVAAAATQNMTMARLYAVLSVVSSLAVIGAGLMRVIIHFMLKNDLISECTTLLQNGTVEFVFGFWGPVVEKNVSPQDAENVCKNGWDHDSFTEIIELIIEIVLSLFFIAIAYAYYQQLLDPTSAANALRQPRGGVPSPGSDYAPYPDLDDDPEHGSSYPAHYNPPYLAYNAPVVPPPRYAPPPGPPPPNAYTSGEDVKGYGIGMGDDAKDVKDAEHRPPVSDPFADFEGMPEPHTGAGLH